MKFLRYRAVFQGHIVTPNDRPTIEFQMAAIGEENKFHQFDLVEPPTMAGQQPEHSVGGACGVVIKTNRHKHMSSRVNLVRGAHVRKRKATYAKEKTTGA